MSVEELRTEVGESSDLRKRVEIEDRMVKLLQLAASFARPCKACGELLYFVQHKMSGSMTPYTKEGLNHFVNCPKAQQFQRRKAAEQGVTTS